MTYFRFALALISTVFATSVAAAETEANCASVANPLAARICLVSQEVARLEANGTVRGLACDSAATGTAPSDCAVHVRLSTSGPSTFVDDSVVAPRSQVANESFTTSQQRGIFRARQRLLQTAEARAAAGGAGARDDRGLFLLLPLGILLLLFAAGGGGSGDPISPS